MYSTWTPRTDYKIASLPPCSYHFIFLGFVFLSNRESLELCFLFWPTTTQTNLRPASHDDFARPTQSPHTRSNQTRPDHGITNTSNYTIQTLPLDLTRLWPDPALTSGPSTVAQRHPAWPRLRVSLAQRQIQNSHKAAQPLTTTEATRPF